MTESENVSRIKAKIKHLQKTCKHIIYVVYGSYAALALAFVLYYTLVSPSNTKLFVDILGVLLTLNIVALPAHHHLCCILTEQYEKLADANKQKDV